MDFSICDHIHIRSVFQNTVTNIAGHPKDKSKLRKYFGFVAHEKGKIVNVIDENSHLPIV